MSVHAHGVFLQVFGSIGKISFTMSSSISISVAEKFFVPFLRPFLGAGWSIGPVIIGLLVCTGVEIVEATRFMVDWPWGVAMLLEMMVALCSFENGFGAAKLAEILKTPAKLLG